MPRMVFWNVQHFSKDKFFDRVRPRASDEDEEWGTNPAEKYRKVLVKTITANDPDFIVIVEARPGGQATGGTLLKDEGSMQLLGLLRDQDADWALVPPLISGSGNAGEGVLVYFKRTDDMYFTGPWRWPGAAGPARKDGPPGVYPYPYKRAFTSKVDDRKVPDGAQYNAGQTERNLAGQWKYTTNSGSMVFFGGSRMPFRTTFYDRQADENYTIMGCHTAPGQNGGTAAPSVLDTSTIGGLKEVQQIGANETIVVAGDFNVSLFDNATSTAAYDPFTRAGYTKVFTAAGAMPADYPERGYLSTHLKRPKGANPSNTRGYPAFGYMSGENGPYGQYDSIDNALVRGGTVANATIANIVTGAPYDQVTPPPTGVPTGTLPYPSRLGNPRTLNVPRGYVPTKKLYRKWTEVFQDIDNYQGIYNVSDHLPLVFDF